MKYKGERLKLLLTGNTELREKVYAALKNDRKKGIEYYYTDVNITVNKLSDLMAATGKTVEYFIEFKDSELQTQSRVSGTGNVVNSTIVSNEERIIHLSEVVKLKDEMLKEKERIIQIKDSQLESLNKKYDELLAILKSDKFRTF